MINRTLSTLLSLCAALAASPASADVLQYQITTSQPASYTLFFDTSVPDADPKSTAGEAMWW